MKIFEMETLVRELHSDFDSFGADTYARLAATCFYIQITVLITLSFSRPSNFRIAAFMGSK